jgi:hypothetical protein
MSARNIITIGELKDYLRGLGDAYPRIEHATQVNNIIIEVAVD